MEPAWIRPTYLRIMCLVGLLLCAFGALGLALGIVHTAAPDLQRQGDPIFRIASAVVNVAEPVYRANQQNTGNPEDPTATTAFSEAKSELTKQAREAGVNQILRGAFLFIIGLLIFLFHWRRAESAYKLSSATRPPEVSPSVQPQVATAAMPVD